MAIPKRKFNFIWNDITIYVFIDPNFPGELKKNEWLVHVEHQTYPENGWHENIPMIPTTTSGYRSGYIGCENPNEVTNELAHKYLLKELGPEPKQRSLF